MSDHNRNKPSARATGRSSFDAKALKRPALDLPKDRTSFSAKELSQKPVVRDQDNVQIRPKPRGITLDHPRLAPPGMSGIKTSARERRQANQSAFTGRSGEVHREFKGLASRQVKDRGIDR